MRFVPVCCPHAACRSASSYLSGLARHELIGRPGVERVHALQRLRSRACAMISGPWRWPCRERTRRLLSLVQSRRGTITGSRVRVADTGASKPIKLPTADEWSGSLGWTGIAMIWHLGTDLRPLGSLSHLKEDDMLTGSLLWLLGVPIPVLILIWFFFLRGR